MRGENGTESLVVCLSDYLSKSGNDSNLIQVSVI